MKVKYLEIPKSITTIKNQKVAIIGYGIQGRHQALNLRDSGIEVSIYNRRDEFAQLAKTDGFNVFSAEEAVRKSDIIMMLIPDASQAQFYMEFVAPHINDGSMLVTAHGYSIAYGGLIPKANIDVTLLAPRFPGQVIRDNYQKGEGTLAFFDNYQDITGTGQERGIALAKAIGLTKLLKVGLVEETRADLFIENYLIPRVMGTIESCYHILVKNGISPEVAALESYQSGEILGLFQDGLKLGLYESFIKRTSPTCQFGVADGHDKVNEFGMKAGEEIYNSIINGDFVNRLKIEENSGYLKRNTFNQKNLKSEFSKTLLRLRS